MSDTEDTKDAILERLNNARANAKALKHPFPPQRIIEDLADRLAHFHPQLKYERSKTERGERKNAIRKGIEAVAGEVETLRKRLASFEKKYPDAADDARFNVNARFNLALGDTSLSELMKAVKTGLILTSRKYTYESFDFEVIRIIENTWRSGRDNGEKLKTKDTVDGAFICFLAAALGTSNGTARDRWRAFNRARTNAVEQTEARGLERQQG
ncbi:hypothetical protein [Aeromonas rivipollensis]